MINNTTDDSCKRGIQIKQKINEAKCLPLYSILQGIKYPHKTSNVLSFYLSKKTFKERVFDNVNKYAYIQNNIHFHHDRYMVNFIH